MDSEEGSFVIWKLFADSDQEKEGRKRGRHAIRLASRHMFNLL
jgi:hypothetical protein